MSGGFTLMEAMIVVTLLGIVGLSFAALMVMSQRFMSQSVSFSNSQGDASFALEHIKRYVTLATAITVPAAGASGNQLTFRWRPRAGQLERESDYTLNGTDLRVVVTTFNNNGTVNNVAAPERVARGIQSAGFPNIFTRDTAGRTITVNITARGTSGGDTRDTRLQTTFSPRGLF